jgi:hypothetical protein
MTVEVVGARAEGTATEMEGIGPGGGRTGASADPRPSRRARLRAVIS